MIKEAAINILSKSTHPLGFLATAQAEENYGRVWSRDSAITALAICLHEIEELYPTIKKSILTLGENQLENGLIPSNVGVNTSGDSIVSYGTLVGRVDAQTWWIIQSCLFLKLNTDEELKRQLRPKLIKTLQVLDILEYNARNLVYTPLGGNWADEYLISGYTLYDNVLRYLALHLFLQIYPDELQFQEKRHLVYTALVVNFTNESQPESMQINPRSKAIWQERKMPYFPAAFDASKYAPFWDAAANGLALLLGFDRSSTIETIQSYIHDSNIGFVPAFWPVIQPNDPEWNLLEQQFNYAFKNKPFHFHNGGSWPVMTGILGLGLRSQNCDSIVDKMKYDYEQFLQQTDKMQFSEYISLDEKLPGGKKELCFSAAGYLFLCANKQQIKKVLNL